jgi:polyphenol oxidase
MLIIRDSSFYQSTKLSSVPGVTHGYSSRVLGDMRHEDKRISFLHTLRISDSELMPGQVHGSTVVMARGKNQKAFRSADGLIIQKDCGHDTVPVGVLVADCVPILIADKHGLMLAAVHAGWKGTLKNIVGHAIDAYLAAGVDKKNIIVSLGPRIGGCCYEVPRSRAALFISQFGNDKRVAFQSGGNTWHVDIGYVNALQLRTIGIPEDNIDMDAPCTAEDRDMLYSYRKDTKKSFGEIMGVIGFSS